MHLQVIESLCGAVQSHSAVSNISECNRRAPSHAASVTCTNSAECVLDVSTGSLNLASKHIDGDHGDHGAEGVCLRLQV